MTQPKRIVDLMQHVDVDAVWDTVSIIAGCASVEQLCETDAVVLEKAAARIRARLRASGRKKEDS